MYTAARRSPDVRSTEFEPLEGNGTRGGRARGTTPAKDAFDTSDGPVVGMTGLIDNPAGYHAVWDCDVLVGTDFPYDEFLLCPKAGRLSRSTGRSTDPGDFVVVRGGEGGAREVHFLGAEERDADGPLGRILRPGYP
jgi:hypothetical protein